MTTHLDRQAHVAQWHRTDKNLAPASVSARTLEVARYPRTRRLLGGRGPDDSRDREVNEMNIVHLIAQTTTAAGSATPAFSAWAVVFGIGALFFLAFLVMLIAWIRTWGWNDAEGMEKLRGLGLPNGTVRSVLALLVVGGFILFAFIGRGIVGDNDQFTAILAAWVTLTGAVTGFYFGARTGQTLDSGKAAPDEEPVDPGADDEATADPELGSEPSE